MINENITPDIIVGLKTDDYVISDAIIDPITKDNVSAYVLKDNALIYFSFANHEITSKVGTVTNLYYRTYKNKNLIIRNREFSYVPATEIMAVHEDTFEVLKATNRLNDTLFKFNIIYSVKENGQEIQKSSNFYFKVVGENQYEAYKEVSKASKDEEDNGEIKRPKKQK